MEHSKYYVICTPLGKICPKEFAMSSDWDEEEEDQAKDKDKDQEQPQTNHSLSTAMTITLKLSKPFMTKYLDIMTSKSPIMYMPKEKHRWTPSWSSTY